MAMQPLDDETCRAAADALAASKGNISAAARTLGLTRSTFQHHVKVAARRGMLAPSPGETWPGFVIADQTSIYDADGNLKRVSIRQKKQSDDEFELPEGHAVKGVSALTDADGRIVQRWIKTDRRHDPAPLIEAIRAAGERFRHTVAVKHEASHGT